MNNAVNRSTGHSPFFLNYGFHPTHPVWRELDVNVPAAKEFAVNFESRLTDAKASLEAAQQRAADYYNRNKKDVIYSAGQLVMLSTKHLRKNASGSRKMLPRWIGPFPVVRMVGSSAVELTLPPDMHIHPTFHSSLVRLYRTPEGSEPMVTDPAPTWLPEKDRLWDVERILDFRYRSVRIKGKLRKIPEWFTKWKGFPPEENSWEPKRNFTSDLWPQLDEMRKRFLADRKAVTAGTLSPEGG
jgi:hypothetical protein